MLWSPPSQLSHLNTEHSFLQPPQMLLPPEHHWSFPGQAEQGTRWHAAPPCFPGSEPMSPGSSAAGCWGK